MGFTIYMNVANPHVTIHRDGCFQIKKRGGVHKYGQGGYYHYLTFKEARENAEKTNLPIRECSFCKPC